MYKTSKEYKKVIYSEDSNNIPFLTINGTQIDYNQIESIEISSPIIDTEEEYFYIGTFISQKLTINFRNTDNISLDGEVYLEIGSKVDLTDEEAEEVEKYENGYEYIKIGHFIIDTSTEDFYSGSKLICMDKATLFKPSVDISKSMTDGKVMVETLLKWLTDYFEVELGTYPEHPNLYKTISSCDNTTSGKTYISWIAELLGCNAKMDRDGKLCLMPLKSDPVETIEVLKGKSWEISEKYHISKVTFDNGILAKTYPEEIEEDAEVYNTLTLRTANLFLQEEDFEERVSNVYDSVVDFEIYSLTYEGMGDPSLDCWDIVTYNLGQDEEGNDINYNSFYNSDLTYSMTLMTKNDITIPTKQQEATTSIISNTITEIRTVKSEVSQLDGKLTITATLAETNQSNIEQNTNDIKSNTSNLQDLNDNLTNNYYQKSTVEELVLNSSNGLTNTFSEAGGNNVLRNTNFSATEVLEEGQYYEYWYGDTTRTTNNNSANGYSIKLKNDTLYQEQTIANGQYTLSFYYKKSNEFATCKVVINGTSYDLTETDDFELFQTGTKDDDGNYLVKPIVINNNYIKVEFIADIDNSCEIYDIMLNSGTIKLAYSQNQNETITDTVNIGKGITITASDSDVKFVATSQGISIKDKNASATDDPITEFTDKGMTTKEAVVEDEATIVGILRQRVGDQVWDSLI
jgi:hypothetical protein